MSVGLAQQALSGVTPIGPTADPQPNAPVNPTGSPVSPVPDIPTTPTHHVGHVMTDKWAGYAGRLGAAVAVGGTAAIIRRGGHEPDEPDDQDVRLLKEAIEEGLKIAYEGQPVPWWMGGLIAYGNVYAAMRIGAKPLKEKPIQQVQTSGDSSEVADEPAPRPVQNIEPAEPPPPQATNGFVAPPEVKKTKSKLGPEGPTGEPAISGALFPPTMGE